MEPPYGDYGTRKRRTLGSNEEQYFVTQQTYLFGLFWDFPVLQSLGGKGLIVLKYMKKKK